MFLIHSLLNDNLVHLSAIRPAGVIANQSADWCGNLNVHRIAHPIPIGHDGTLYFEIATVALLPRNDTVVVGNYTAKR